MAKASFQGRGMASVISLLLLLPYFLTSCSALVYNVGDRSAWTLSGVNYNSWAASKNFRANDVLRFSYSSPLHNVVQVSKSDYNSCTASRALATYSNGNTLVRLPRPGTYYFICGVPGHCETGMKMQVTVH